LSIFTDRCLLQLTGKRWAELREEQQGFVFGRNQKGSGTLRRFDP